MTLFLLLSCGSGGTKAEDPQSRFLKSVISLSNDFLDVFTSFGEMISGTLGFKADSKKADVGKYFTRIADTMTSVREKLQDKVAKNDNYPKIKEVVDKFITGTLDKIAEGAKTAGEAIGTTGGDLLGNVVAAGANAGSGSAKGETENLIKGIKSIVDVVFGDKEGSADAGDSNKAEDGEARANNTGAVKLFISGNNAAGNDAANAKKAAADAAKAVGAVTGADILQAMIKEGGAAARLAENNDAQVAGVAAPKDAEVAGGIALRAMAKDGKFANGAANADVSTAVKGAAVSAVTKALGTLTIAIRNTVDTGLKSIGDALATVTQEDKSLDSTTPADAATGGQKQ
ncbi:variable large family protein [Borrelia turicatae]|uniref:variable large family protein n=1 Tax=Borrelia turicatae TaxID=142 RepID=UPI002ED64D89